MSTVPEVAVAATYGLKVMAMSIITNVAKPDVLEETTGEEVVDAGMIAAPKLKSIVEDAIQRAAQKD
jgi:purine-nucleoside phosphorylase